MFFVGLTALSSPSTFNHMPTDFSDCKNIKITNMICEEFYISKDKNAFGLEIPVAWDNNTILYAKFDGTLDAGNVKFTAQDVNGLVLKRKEIGKQNWTIVKKWRVNSIDDFTFTEVDRYNKSKKSYQYSLTPLYDDIAGNVSIQDVYSEFEGLCIADAEKSVSTYLDVQFDSLAKNKPSASNVTLAGKYPSVIKNGETNYYSGTVSALFVKLNDKTYSLERSVDQEEYQREIVEWLNGVSNKIIKYEDGMLYFASITNPPSYSFSSNNENRPISFSFTEIADAEDNDALKNNGMIVVEE